MGYQLNEKLKYLQPYEPISGHYNVRLDANESYFSLPRSILDRCFEKIANSNLNRYPDPYAKDLCEAFSSYYNIDSNHVTVGNGSDELIGVIAGTFLQKGDKMLVSSPDFSMYKFYGEIYELQVQDIKKGKDLIFPIDKIIDTANQEDIKAIFFSNPCNPTSLGVKRDDVIRLIQSVSCLVIVDEAYMDFYDQSILDIAHKFDNVIVLKTSSKAIGTAGLRLGYAIANTTLTYALKAAKSPYNVNSVSQLMGCEIFKHKEYLDQCIADIKTNKDSLYQNLLELNQKYQFFDTIYKSDTNFIFIKTKYSKEIFEQLLDRSIAIRYMGDFIRITTGNKEENNTLLMCLDNILINMKKSGKE